MHRVSLAHIQLSCLLFLLSPRRTPFLHGWLESSIKNADHHSRLFSMSKHFISNTIIMTCCIHILYCLTFSTIIIITVNLCRESYISGRMLNTFSYGSGLSQLPKRDNLHIKDKRPVYSMLFVQRNSIPSNKILTKYRLHKCCGCGC